MATVWSYIVLIMVVQIIAVAPIYAYYIVSAIEISVSYDMMPHNKSKWLDITLMGYDAMIIYYCNESIWYQHKMYQYHMMHQCDMIYKYDITRQQWYDLSVWHDMTWQQYDILFCLKLGYLVSWLFGVLTFQCIDPSMLLCNVFQRLGFWPGNAVILKRLSLRAISNNKKSEILSRRVSPRFKCAMIRHILALVSCIY